MSKDYYFTEHIIADQDKTIKDYFVLQKVGPQINLKFYVVSSL